MTAPGPAVLTADRRTAPAHEVDLPGLAALLGAVLAAEGVLDAAECSLSLVDPDEIAALKVEHLDGTGAPTDVLSFPVDGAAAPGDGTPWMVGDVVLCPEVAAAQAAGHAGSAPDEMALLVVHGGLHLVGWDHATDADRLAMWARERELLESLHGVPAGDPWAEVAT